VNNATSGVDGYVAGGYRTECGSGQYIRDGLAGGGVFDIVALVLRIDDRSVKFVPTFLYGQGVTGCLKATFHNGGVVTPLARLFMRSGTMNNRSFTPPGALSRRGQSFGESTFFNLIFALLP
jgi:hypothetical protein